MGSEGCGKGRRKTQDARRIHGSLAALTASRLSHSGTSSLCSNSRRDSSCCVECALHGHWRSKQIANSKYGYVDRVTHSHSLLSRPKIMRAWQRSEQGGEGSRTTFSMNHSRTGEEGGPVRRVLDIRTPTLPSLNLKEYSQNDPLNHDAQALGPHLDATAALLPSVYRRQTRSSSSAIPFATCLVLAQPAVLCLANAPVGCRHCHRCLPEDSSFQSVLKASALF